MEREHRNRINRKFRSQLKGKQLIVLGIPDEYEFMQPELVRLLEVQLQRWVGSVRLRMRTVTVTAEAFQTRIPVF